MIDKFFVTVNRIYQVRRMRPWGQRALLYWALITLGPLVIAFSLTVSTQAFRSASEGVDASAVEWSMAVLQFIVQVASYTFLYKFVPNCHVQLSHAAAGGVSASLAGLAVREAFGHYVSAGTLTSIYGAFVAFPVLLLWFYVSWLIVFGGAAVTATIPLLTSGRFADSYKRGNDFLTGVALLKVLWRHRREGETSVGVTTLADEVDSYPQAARRILLRLAEKGYCVEIMSEKPQEPQRLGAAVRSRGQESGRRLHGAPCRRQQPSHESQAPLVLARRRHAFRLVPGLHVGRDACQALGRGLCRRRRARVGRCRLKSLPAPRISERPGFLQELGRSVFHGFDEYRADELSGRIGVRALVPAEPHGEKRRVGAERQDGVPIRIKRKARGRGRNDGIAVGAGECQWCGEKERQHHGDLVGRVRIEPAVGRTVGLAVAVGLRVDEDGAKADKILSARCPRRRATRSSGWPFRVTHA